MSELSEARRTMGRAIKAQFSELEIPGVVSRKVSTKMRLEARLKSGADLFIACSPVGRGHVPGAYGLYWLFSLTGGFVYDVMDSLGLSAAPNFSTPLIFSCTSHNLPSASHFDVSSAVDVDSVAATMCRDVREHALPLIAGYESEPEHVLDYILRRGPGVVRNPFTQCVILMNRARRIDRLNEIIEVASAARHFYDFRGSADARRTIVEPVANWFAATG